MKRISAVFIVTAVLMLAIFQGADWYASNAALPRYCADPDAAIRIVREIMTKPDPGTGKEKRPYVVAAKLIFLVPRNESEPLEAYFVRLKLRIAQSCTIGT